MQKIMQKALMPLLALLLCCTVSGCSVLGTRPFEGLRESDVASVTVRMIPPDTELRLTEAEIETFLELLRQTVVYQRDDSYTEYDGQAVLFTVTGTDGTVTTINAYSPFLIIDDRGYRCGYTPCQALSSFANGLRK